MVCLECRQPTDRAPRMRRPSARTSGVWSALNNPVVAVGLVAAAVWVLWGGWF